MSLTANGTWFPSPTPDFPPGEGTGNGRGLLSGTGVPDDSVGANGNIYIDLSTGDIYTKAGDTWTLKSGGAGGSVQVISGAFVDPNIGGVVPDDPTMGAIYTCDGTPYSLWKWNHTAQNWSPQITA